jgi:cathepsin L
MAFRSIVSFTYMCHVFHPSSATQSYQSFCDSHDRDFMDESVSAEVRQQLFEQRKAEVAAHNSMNRSWSVAINKFSDFTDQELQSRLGYKRVGGRWHASSTGSMSIGSSSLMQAVADEYEGNVDTDQLASEVDFNKQGLKSAAWIRNQGSCGSCWAVAATGAIEIQLERAQGVAKKLAVQQIVDCVPNPHHCGGAGGCKGATGELAFEYSRKNGIMYEDDYKGSAQCTGAPASVKLNQFVRLPENSAKYLHHALATKGPVVVSVDGSDWFSYAGGVYAGCKKDTIVNHAALAVGYGHEPSSKKDYWLVRNSWGEDWGEKGHLRVERHMDDKAYCGVDNKPKEGVYCDNAPSEITVCGMCGITSDSAYPVLAGRGNLRKRAQARKFESDAEDLHSDVVF